MIKAKNSELLQAQIATYAAERSEDPVTKSKTITAIQNILTGSFSTDSYESFLSFLRAVGGSKYEAIRERSHILRNYPQFEQAVSELQRELAQLDSKINHPNYLGSGHNADAYSITLSEKQFVVRIPHDKKLSANVVDDHMAAALLAKNMDNLEHLVAASYLEGVTVSELMPGKTLGRLSLTEVSQITVEHLQQLLLLLQKANRKEIEIDPKPSNYLFDQKTSFGIIDIHSAKIVKNSRDQSLEQAIADTATALCALGLYGNTEKQYLTPDDYKTDLALYQNNLRLLLLYKNEALSLFNFQESSEVIQNINTVIQRIEAFIKKYSDDAWVASQVQENLEQKSRKKAKASSVITVTL